MSAVNKSQEISRNFTVRETGKEDITNKFADEL
jgi:hypothetical protein